MEVWYGCGGKCGGGGVGRGCVMSTVGETKYQKASNLMEKTTRIKPKQTKHNKKYCEFHLDRKMKQTPFIASKCKNVVRF
jgi:hypothetical protein